MTEAEAGAGDIPKGLSMSLDALIKQDRGKPGQQRQQNGSQTNRRDARGQQRGRGRGPHGQGGRGGGRGRFNDFQQQSWQVIDKLSLSLLHLLHTYGNDVSFSCISAIPCSFPEQTCCVAENPDLASLRESGREFWHVIGRAVVCRVLQICVHLIVVGLADIDF